MGSPCWGAPQQGLMAPTSSEFPDVRLQYPSNPERALFMIEHAIDQARSDGADVVILGGAGLVGFAERLQNHVKVPLLDSLSCAVSQAVAVSAV